MRRHWQRLVPQPGENPFGLVRILRQDANWRRTRRVFFWLQPCCQMCARQDKLHVHHIYPWHMFPDLRYELDNLITLCSACHLRFGHNNNWKDYNSNLLELVAEAQRLRQGEVDWGSFVRDQDVVNNWIEMMHSAA
jgi:hypothetical protein